MSTLTLRSVVAQTLRTAQTPRPQPAFLASSALLALTLAGPAMAQQAPAKTSTAPADTLEEVVVTGIRAAIESAIAVKEKSDGIVEAISAEDIGKLPDTSIAESLARLPGVTTQRDRLGNATNVSIRGLGPDFNGYLLNGREQTSTGDSRAVDLSVYPAELIGSATVYKTADAALPTAGLAGTIDTRLVDPLSYHGLVVAANAEQTKNGVGLPVQGKGKRYSFSFIDQFFDRKLGIALGFVHSDNKSSALSSGSWGGNHPAIYSDNGTNQIANWQIPDPAHPGQTMLDNSRAVASNGFLGGLTYETDHNTDNRDGGAVILEFKPNDAFTSEIDGYYAHIKTATHKIELQRGSNGAPVDNATISGSVVTSGTITMPPYSLIDRNENIFDDDTIQSLGWLNKLQFSDKLTASLDLSHNSAKRVERDIEAYAGIATADTLSFTNGGASVPSFTLGNPTAYTNASTIAIHDVAGWSGVNYPPGSPYAGQHVPQAGYDKGPTVTDKLSAGRFELAYDLGEGGFFRKAAFGVNYAKRTKERITDEGVLTSAANGGYDPIPFPSGAGVESNVGGTGLNVLAFGPTANLWPGVVLLRKYNDDILSKTWTIEEKVTTVYGKLDIDSHTGDVPLRGNLGLQVIRTDQSSGGYRADISSSVTLTNPAGTLTTAGTTYTDVLPSLNLVWDFGQGNLVRFGLGEQIARPTLTDLRNSLAVSADTNAADTSTFGRFVGSSGNPYLKPFKAKAVDLSYEKYFQSRAYVSAAVFYKKLDTYITQYTNAAYDFTNIATQLGLAPAPLGNIGTYTQTVNGQGGNIRGVELAGSMPLSLLTEALNGFGLLGSYSVTQSSVALPNVIGLNPSQQVPSTGTMSLPGLSHVNAKVEFYFERAGFSAFIAENSRSEYIASVANTSTGGYPTLIYIEPQKWVSAQAGYEFQSGPMKGLAFRFEGNNMNKPTYIEKKSDGSINTTVKTGATYAFKVAYKFK